LTAANGWSCEFIIDLLVGQFVSKRFWGIQLDIELTKSFTLVQVS
jgi:hypothetical protein